MDFDTAPGFARGICCLSSGSTLVTDADEEIFLLYTALASKASQNNGDTFRGLGYLDSHKDVLTVEFTVPSDPRKRKGKSKRVPEEGTFEVQIAQDKTALRSRNGDTGSVLWKASADFAQLLLSQRYASDALLDPTKLADAHVLELGAGTGLLAVVLSSLVRQYTATDIEALVPLIAKNLASNKLDISRPISGSSKDGLKNVTAEALDWATLKNCPPSSRRTAFSYPPLDLLLIVDCIYHPSLLPSLVETINYLATAETTAVLVVVELRAEDVLREFLELWLAAGDGCWEIWRVDELMKGPYAMWVGWKKAINV